MTDKELEGDLLKHNHYCEPYFVNYKDFCNSTGSPLAYFAIAVNRTLFFLQKDMTVCAWGYYNVNILPTLVLWLTQWFHTPHKQKLCNLSIIYDESKCWLFNLQHYVCLYASSTYTQQLPLKSHNLPTAVTQRCQITIISPNISKRRSLQLCGKTGRCLLFSFLFLIDSSVEVHSKKLSTMGSKWCSSTHFANFQHTNHCFHQPKVKHPIQM